MITQYLLQAATEIYFVLFEFQVVEYEFSFSFLNQKYVYTLFK